MSDLVLVSAERAEWARQINAAWQSSVEGILRCGELLIGAKGDPKLLHGEFMAMVDKDLPFGISTADKLMQIARHPVLTNSEYIPNFPPSWGTMSEIAKLSGSEVVALIADGRIHPEVKQADIVQLRKKNRRVAREQNLAAATMEASNTLGSKLYNVIYADPPWRFEPYSRETGMDRAADNHYQTMAIEDIYRLAVPAAEDCVLFLWSTVPMLPHAFDVMRGWGFTYRSHFVWVKDRTGTGYWNRNRHEVLLLGTRGEVPAPAPGEQFSSVIEAAISRHSEKPFRFREMIEEMFPTVPRVELFARERFAGWDAWGNEVEEAAA